MITNFLISNSSAIILIGICIVLISQFISGVYKPFIQLGGIVVLCLGIYAYGVDSERKEWTLRMQEATNQINELRIKSEKINTQTVIEYRDRIKIVEKTVNVPVTEFVINDQCKINEGFVNLHDSIIDNKTPEIKDNNKEQSDISLVDIAETMKFNYEQSMKNSEQLKSLQDWIRKQQDEWNK